MSKGPFYRSDPFRKNALPPEVTVMVKYKDGRTVAHPKITNPWPYIISIKKDPQVVAAWIEKK